VDSSREHGNVNEFADFWAAMDEHRHDLGALLDLVARRVVSLLGDGCVLATVSEDGQWLHPTAIAHVDPEVEAAMRAVLETGDTRIGEGLAGTVAADRRSMLLNDLQPATIAETTPAQYLPFVRDHPMRALAIAPLLAAGELVGTLGAVRTSSDRPFTAEDLRLVEGLAERAALAIGEALAGPRSVGPKDYEALYRHSLEGVLITTPDGHILAANPAACEILGMTEHEILKAGRRGLMVAEDPNLPNALAERATAGRARAELGMYRGDGSTIVADVASTIFTDRGRTRAVVIFRDVTEQATAREIIRSRVDELEHAANRDVMTGLLNRRGFTIAAEQALAACDRHGDPSCLLFVDLDGLKAINDRGGHGAGDAAIIEVASAIHRALREEDVACRLGGDEFIVLLVDTDLDGARLVEDRIRAGLGPGPDGEALSISTGTVERVPEVRALLDELIEAADREMYQQKILHRLHPPDEPLLA
jgi:diguanylate cyclase (GGDEF)-like protein/PAS domain S-box-containing protein